MRAIDTRAAWALGLRDLRRYFHNPTGYVFLTLFIFLSAGSAFWRPRFFLNNLATLDQLNELFPYLLLLFVPALCMGIWSEERKQGTDELLLTLPITEREVIAGKFVAVLGIYGISLFLALSLAAVLFWLGRPDPGLLASNYLGYWLLGVLLIPLAMLGSLVSANATVAFVLGLIFCSVPVGVDLAAGGVSNTLARIVGPFSARTNFSDFSRGIVSLSGILYFLLIGLGALCLDMLVLSVRRWPEWDRPRLRHVLLRSIGVVMIIGSIILLAARAHARLDVTAGRIHSLSPETKRLLLGLSSDRPVFIQAFISPEVPEPYVQTREDLLSVLREIEAFGGSRVTVTVFITEPYSDQARFARDRYDIEPRSIVDLYAGEHASDVYLAAALTASPGGGDEQVIGFFDRGLSAEYELARAIRVVSRSQRKRVGLVDGDVKIFGGMDFRNNEARPAWEIVDELRKQYEIVELTPMSAIKEQVDALVVVMPSRLSQSEIDLVLQPIRRGTPTLVLLDPLPAVDIRLAPAAQLAEEVNPYRQEAVSVRRSFGDVRAMLRELGIDWVPARIGFDSYNPHPDMAQLPAEAVFVSAGNGNPHAFDRADSATAGLQEILFVYPGCLAPANSSRFAFEPLISTGPLSGVASFFDVVRPARSGLELTTSFTHRPGKEPNVLAAHVRTNLTNLTGGAALTDGARPVNVIAVADLDFIADNFFDIRAGTASDASFDNITFFLNAIDELVGDDSFIALRNHHVSRRALERVERETRGFMERRRREEQQADVDAQAALNEARERLKARIDEIDRRHDLDDEARQAMTRNLKETEDRRFRVLAANIQAEKNRRVLKSRETMESDTRRIRGVIRVVSVLAPPIPVLVVGIVIFYERRKRETLRTSR